MTIFSMLFVLLGVSYVSYLFMKFIVWLDGAEEQETESAVTEGVLLSEPTLTGQHKNAA